LLKELKGKVDSLMVNLNKWLLHDVQALLAKQIKLLLTKLSIFNLFANLLLMMLLVDPESNRHVATTPNPKASLIKKYLI
jgi:hypothetical protein